MEFLPSEVLERIFAYAYSRNVYLVCRRFSAFARSVSPFIALELNEWFKPLNECLVLLPGKQYYNIREISMCFDYIMEICVTLYMLNMRSVIVENMKSALIPFLRRWTYTINISPFSVNLFSVMCSKLLSPGDDVPTLHKNDVNLTAIRSRFNYLSFCNHDSIDFLQVSHYRSPGGWRLYRLAYSDSRGLLKACYRNTHKFKKIIITCESRCWIDALYLEKIFCKKCIEYNVAFEFA
jgi:hypothetical protein